MELSQEINDFLKTDEGKAFFRAIFPEISNQNRWSKIKSQVNPPKQMLDWMETKEKIETSYFIYRELRKD